MTEVNESFNQTLNLIISIIKNNEAVEPEKINGTDDFDNLGIDSIVIIETLITIEKKLGVKIEESDVSSCRNLEELSVIVESRLGD